MARTFRTTLQGVERSGGSAFVAVPAPVMREFGGRTRVPIRVTIAGTRSGVPVTYRTTICNMGFGRCFGVRKDLRDEAGIVRGSRITVTLEEDRARRTVTVPAYLRKAMDATVRKAFDAMSYTYRKEHVAWVGAAKRIETRERRIALLVADVRARSKK